MFPGQEEEDKVIEYGKLKKKTKKDGQADAAGHHLTSFNTTLELETYLIN